MDLATIICNYIYGAFQIIKTAVDVLVDTFEMAIEKLCSLANTINNAIFTTLGKALDAILLIVTNALSALVRTLNQSVNGTWSLCANAFRCNFFLEQILDPDSLIAQTIRKILSSKDDCYCRRNPDGTVTITGESNEDSIYNMQQTLYDIATDYENFKAQICTGLSLDLATDMLVDMCLDYESQLNKWKTKIAAKIKSLRKKLQGLLDLYMESNLFDLLEQLQAFFECVIDTELCANVDTVKSYYHSILSKLYLVESGVGEFCLSPNFENEILGTCNSFLAKLNSGLKKIQGMLGTLSCSVSIKGASNALDLTTTIIGIHHLTKDAIAGRKIEWNQIPIIDYTHKTSVELYEAYSQLHGKTTTDTEDALKSNRCYTLNDALLDTVAEGDTTEYLEVEPGTDTTHAQELIQVGDRFYTVADAAKQLYTGKGDAALLNYCRNVGGMLNVDDIVTRY
jgi:hypothetical protein